MDRNYCFRRKRHSYAACDAALAASCCIIDQGPVQLWDKVFGYKINYYYSIRIYFCFLYLESFNKPIRGLYTIFKRAEGTYFILPISGIREV